MHPGEYMIELCSLRLIDAKLSQVEDGQGIEGTFILLEQTKSAINSRKHNIDALMK